jgi:hypothetical protein
MLLLTYTYLYFRVFNNAAGSSGEQSTHFSASNLSAPGIPLGRIVRRIQQFVAGLVVALAAMGLLAGTSAVAGASNPGAAAIPAHQASLTATQAAQTVAYAANTNGLIVMKAAAKKKPAIREVGNHTQSRLSIYVYDKRDCKGRQDVVKPGDRGKWKIDRSYYVSGTAEARHHNRVKIVHGCNNAPVGLTVVKKR